MQPAIYRTVIGNDFQCLYRTPQSAPILSNAAEAEVPRYIQNHAAQVDQWRQMVNAACILKQKFLESQLQEVEPGINQL